MVLRRTVSRKPQSLAPARTGSPWSCRHLWLPADAFESEDHEEGDEYTAERNLSDKPDPSTPEARLYNFWWEGFAALRKLLEPPSSFVPRYTSAWLD